MATPEERLTALEQGIVGIIGRMDQSITRLQNEDVDLRNRLDTTMGLIDGKITDVETRVGTVETHVAGVTVADIAQLQNIVSAIAGSDLPQFLGEIVGMKVAMTGADQEIQGLQTQITSQIAKMGIMEGVVVHLQHKEASRDQKTDDKKRHTKPIMDHRCWEHVKNLDSDKSTYRDWKVRFKDAIKQVTGAKGWRKLMHLVEDPGARLRTDVTSEDLKDKWVEHLLHNPEDGNENDFEVLSGELETILLNKSEDKSQAFLLNQRAQCGILAWVWINNWYMAISGQGVSRRMGKIMNPPQAKSDAEVMIEVEKWLDEARELVAMGQDDLPPGYKVSAIKSIATQRIRDQMEIQEAKMHHMTPEAVWSELRDTALNLSESKIVEEREKGKKSQMDVGHLGEGIDLGGKGSWMQESNAWQGQWESNMVKGKGKGKGFTPYGKGGKGYGGYSTKGGGKGGK